MRRQCLACAEPYTVARGGKALPFCEAHKAALSRVMRRRKDARRRQLAAWKAERPRDSLWHVFEDWRVRQATREAAWQDDERARWRTGELPAEGASLSGQAYHAADSADDEDGWADDGRADGLDVFDHADETAADREAVHGASASEYVAAEDRQPAGTYTVDGADEGASAGRWQTRVLLDGQAFHAANHPWWVAMPPEVVFYALGELDVNEWGELVRELTTDRLAECGTYAGWKAHNRRGEAPCEPCRRAKSERNRADYARRKGAA